MPGEAMTTREEAERVAAGLNPTEKALIRGPLYSAIKHGIPAAWFHDVKYWGGRRLAKLGLAERRIVETGWVASIPTPLGLAVASLLKEGRT